MEGYKTYLNTNERFTTVVLNGSIKSSMSINGVTNVYSQRHAVKNFPSLDEIISLFKVMKSHKQTSVKNNYKTSVIEIAVGIVVLYYLSTFFLLF